MRELANYVRGGEIARCGHWRAKEHSETLARELVAFLAKVPERG